MSPARRGLQAAEATVKSRGRDGEGPAVGFGGSGRGSEGFAGCRSCSSSANAWVDGGRGGGLTLMVSSPSRERGSRGGRSVGTRDSTALAEPQG